MNKSKLDKRQLDYVLDRLIPSFAPRLSREEMLSILNRQDVAYARGWLRINEIEPDSEILPESNDVKQVSG